MLRSATSRLVALYCLLLLTLGAVFLVFTVSNFRHYTREVIASNLSIRAAGVWSISQNLLNQPVALAAAIQSGFSPEVQNRFIRIRYGDRIIFQSGDPADGRFKPSLIPMDDAANDNARSIGDVLLLSRHYRDPRGRPVVVDIGQSFYFVHTLERELATSIFIALPILLVFAAIGGYVLMRRALSPIETMIKETEAYTFNRADTRLPLVRTEPRIEELGMALNRLLDRLSRAYSHASRFSADAAHELRTPLTIVRGELELLAGRKNLQPEVETAVANALEEITRLSGMVDSLILLSRMESMWGKKSHAPVDLRKLAEDTLVQIGLLAEEKQLRLSGPEGPTVIVAGDPDRLRQVLVNLLDNAIKYTPRDGRITVRVGIEKDRGFISVEDTGIGIASAHLEGIFERFYRVSPDRGEIGAGLGLAIVKSICAAHGGEVTVKSELGQGSIFRVDLPLMPAGEHGALPSF